MLGRSAGRAYAYRVIYRFAHFELDTARAELRTDGQPLPVEPQVFAVLALLVEHGERLVSKDELVEKVWAGRVVSDSAIASRVKSARQALGDDGEAQRYIKTQPRLGFRFVAPTRRVTEAAAGAGARPSIAVLPLRRNGPAQPHAALAHGLACELITDLASIHWLFVCARGSSFRLAPDTAPQDVGQVLGVRYALTGALELQGRRVSVTMELNDTRDGGVVWAERFASPLAALYELRLQLRAGVLAALELRIPAHEAGLARGMAPDNLDAWSAYHLGLQHLYRFNRADSQKAAALFARALELDSRFARAHAGLSFVHFQHAFLRYSDQVDAESAQSRDHALWAVEFDPLDPFVNFAMGRTYWLEGDLDSGREWLQRATDISPNYAQGLYALAWTETLAGLPQSGRDHVNLAMRLSPIDPLHYAMLATRGLGHLACGERAEAAAWAERAARSPGAHVMIAMIAAAAQSLQGNNTLAAHWAADVRERHPQLRRADFFRAFPVRHAPMRSDLEGALLGLGF